MAEFMIVFLVTFLIIGGVALAMAFGRAPVYQPDEAHIQSLFTRLLEGELDDSEWDFFLNMPIRLDPELDKLRQKCVEVQEQHALRAKDGKARLKEEGLIRLRFMLNQLEQGGHRTF
jgi:hypothetical protein